ncbi:MAG: ribonuclease HII [Candidatus Shapirobacteria bacterium]|jgi:ribonuclease HII
MIFLPDFNYEFSQIPPSTRFLLGIDEVGRGPLAGPVTIGAFLLDLTLFKPNEFVKIGVRDSKKLSPQKRQKILAYFSQNQFAYSVFSASSEKIDQQGINVVIKGLILYALNRFKGRFDYCLIDGNYAFDDFSLSSSACPATAGRGTPEGSGILKSLISADSTCFSVAAASICAKVVRDQRMDGYDLLYPQYGFKDHKGYGTKKHLAALQLHGPCPIHRRSFRPVKAVNNQKI